MKSDLGPQMISIRAGKEKKPNETGCMKNADAPRMRSTSQDHVTKNNSQTNRAGS